MKTLFMNSRISSRVMVLVCIGFYVGICPGAAYSASNDILYVQSVKADLKPEPKMASPAFMMLKRGDSLKVIKKEGLWYQVSYVGKNHAEKHGWISQLFVNASRPHNDAELNRELASDQDLIKSSRRRSSSYAASASTRGLTAGNRVRDGREAYMSDPDAVNKMESFQLKENEFRKFREDGNLLR